MTHQLRARQWALFFGIGYLLFLIFPLNQELTAGRGWQQTVIGLTLLAAFVAVDVWFWVRLYWIGSPRDGVLAATALCALATGLTVHDSGWAGTFIYSAVAMGGARLRPQPAVAGLAGLTLIAAVVAVVLHAAAVWLLPIVLLMVLPGMGMIGLARLIESNHELRRAREEVARLAVAEERLRFARDLHDLLGHSLSVIVLKSELAGRLAAASPERAADEIGDVERVAREALREVRQVVAGYRQPSLGQELESARLILQAAGITTRVDASAGRLPAASESTLAWAVRECVTNIVRHSRAQNAYIKLARADDHVDLEVIDDGVGYDGPTHGSGLSGLGERVSAQDGALTFGRRPEGGFRLAVELPLREAPQPAAAEPT